MGHAEFAAPGFAVAVEVDADDHIGADEPQSLNDIEADAAEPEHDAVRSRLHFRGIDDRADAGRHAAADIADLVERRVGADLCYRDFRQHRVVREGRTAHVMMDHLALIGKPAGAIGHEALALGGPDLLAEIGLRIEAIFAFAAFRRVERDDVISLP